MSISPNVRRERDAEFGVFGGSLSIKILGEHFIHVPLYVSDETFVLLHQFLAFFSNNGIPAVSHSLAVPLPAHDNGII